eukprot:4673178-Pyramimonas_sp.AAC.1
MGDSLPGQCRAIRSVPREGRFASAIYLMRHALGGSAGAALVLELQVQRRGACEMSVGRGEVASRRGRTVKTKVVQSLSWPLL